MYVSFEFQGQVRYDGLFKCVELVSICLEVSMVIGPNRRDFPAGRITREVILSDSTWAGLSNALYYGVGQASSVQYYKNAHVFQF